MAKILCIETSTTVCSVAYCENGHVLAFRELFQVNSHASHLTKLIEELFAIENLPELKSIDAVAVSSGPGSYTGLRIGVSTAKGICYALNIPLIAIDSMTIMTYPVAQSNWSDPKLPILFCPLMDARRMEVYTALFDSHMKMVETVSAKIVDEETFLPFFKTNKVVFFGNGADKCKEVISHVNAIFLDACHPVAQNMAHLAEEKFINGQFVDVAYFEPFYLKDFVATIPKKKVI